MRRAAQIRRQRERDAHNAAMRRILPQPASAEQQKARAERIMAAHDAALAEELGLDG